MHSLSMWKRYRWLGWRGVVMMMVMMILEKINCLMVFSVECDEPQTVHIMSIDKLTSALVAIVLIKILASRNMIRCSFRQLKTNNYSCSNRSLNISGESFPSISAHPLKLCKSKKNEKRQNCERNFYIKSKFAQAKLVCTTRRNFAGCVLEDPLNDFFRSVLKTNNLTFLGWRSSLYRTAMC